MKNTGLNLFVQKGKEKGWTFSEINIEDNTIDISFNDRKISQSLKKLSEVYGGLAFYTFETEEAIDQLISIIALQFIPFPQ